MARKGAKREKREWTVFPNPNTGEIDAGELAETMLDGAALLRRVGGVFQATAIRVRDGDGNFWNEGIRINWVSLPAHNLPDERPVPSENGQQPEPESGEVLDPDEFMPVPN